MTARKYIRIALTEDDMAMFEQVKYEVEETTGVSLSDSNFALSVIRQSLKKKSK